MDIEKLERVIGLYASNIITLRISVAAMESVEKEGNTEELSGIQRFEQEQSNKKYLARAEALERIAEILFKIKEYAASKVPCTVEECVKLIDDTTAMEMGLLKAQYTENMIQGQISIKGGLEPAAKMQNVEFTSWIVNLFNKLLQYREGKKAYTMEELIK